MFDIGRGECHGTYLQDSVPQINPGFFKCILLFKLIAEKAVILLNTIISEVFTLKYYNFI